MSNWHKTSWLKAITFRLPGQPVQVYALWAGILGVFFLENIIDPREKVFRDQQSDWKGKPVIWLILINTEAELRDKLVDTSILGEGRWDSHTKISVKNI